MSPFSPDELARRTAALAGWPRRLVAVGLGVLAAAALPPLFAVPLLAVAFTGLVWLIDGAGAARSPARAAFAAGWWFGFGHFIAGLYWITNSLLVDADRFGWLVPFAVSGLSAGLAIFPGLAAPEGPGASLPWRWLGRRWSGCADISFRAFPGTSSPPRGSSRTP